MNKTTTQETFNAKGLPLPRREQFVIVPFYIESVLMLMVILSSKAVPRYWYRPSVHHSALDTQLWDWNLHTLGKLQSCAILLCES